MQTYGIGTALKILLGYPTPYKRNEIVALLNVFSKVSVSVDTYFSQRRHSTTNNLFITIYLVIGGLVFLVYSYRMYKTFKQSDKLKDKTL